MVKKSCVRAHKGTKNHNRQHETASDEISLRDEILDLKRQILILKKTNDQYSVRLRKYEDEAKRRDKELEQLLNPRKNADVAKILSSKGAAILMTLKDQNNALIQMLINRDLHIRRLVAEAKMSKLYASTKQNESYKAEISRLRNLLAKSEETLKENIEERQEQIESIYVDENQIPEISSASDQSSPRDLDELRSTIVSLESNIKYTNDLLAQRNQQISILSEEVNFLRKYFLCKTSRAEVLDCEKLSTKALTRSWPGPLDSKNLSTHDLLPPLQRHRSNDCNQWPPSAPPSPTNHAPDKTPSQILKEEKTPPPKQPEWKRALSIYKELKKLHPQLAINANNDKNETFTKLLDLKTEEENNSQKKDAVDQENSNSDEKIKSNDFRQVSSERTPNSFDHELSPHFSHTFPHSSSNADHIRNCSVAELSPNTEPPRINQDTRQLYSSDSSSAQEEPKTSSTTDFSESKPKEKKSLRDLYCQGLDSSFESENTYSTTQGVRQVQVEVQINCVSLQNYTRHSANGNEGDKPNALHEDTHQKKDFALDTEFNDDDDVIIC